MDEARLAAAWRGEAEAGDASAPAAESASRDAGELGADGEAAPTLLWIDSCVDDAGRRVFAPKALVLALKEVVAIAFPPETSFPWEDM